LGQEKHRGRSFLSPPVPLTGEIVSVRNAVQQPEG
jgi:hypothetical protein